VVVGFNFLFFQKLKIKPFSFSPKREREI